ncbi:uncharacterized protein LOC121735204 [Aricia agestis]|uniref:uncharacterized protein LOC121735204 n=1 Tax=Aricia agestis TaxID=91739 RepID=UPI001C20C104|nr:uncharacterized protein LOC121735204 [Aricia agestis]
MYTLKGIFPEPKKEQKKNFIKENMRQLKVIQNKPKEDLTQNRPSQNIRKPAHPVALPKVKSSSSGRTSKPLLNGDKKQNEVIRIKKGDMAEFLKRKEMRRLNQEIIDEGASSNSSSGRLRDIGCQTIESNLSDRFSESTKLTTLFSKEDSDKVKASGDSGRQKSPSPLHSPLKHGDEMFDEQNRSRVTAILEKNNKDPYLPPGYQKGVLPKYLREKKEKAIELEGVKVDDDGFCPPGHVTLPDSERKETLRMLRNSFAELVNELNKLPVKTDTLRMKTRKMELEKQLTKLEEGIKVFSRPKVFVKIGE